MNVPCFWIEPTGQALRYLRVYATDSARPCAKGSYCNAMTKIGRFPIEYDDQPPRNGHRYERWIDPAIYASGWPEACAACGQPFHVKRSTRQVFTEREMRVVRAQPGAKLAVGATCTIRDGRAIAGAMWDAWWLGDHYAGPDGLHLTVMLPNGHEWLVDGPASNCTKPGDHEHRCWVRHGVPPAVTVDKQGNTCDAGAGSIASTNYHGFLRGGALVEC